MTRNGGRMEFGLFVPPMHYANQNPTRAIRRDLEMIQYADELGFREAWIGEHHSGGAEIIGPSDIFIAAAIERTKRIRIGTGVVSLPYHHPFHVAERAIFLDHLSMGRTMLGVGPGSLPTDAAMMGIPWSETRKRMVESFEAVHHLLTSDEPLTMKTDWFELKDARLHLAPYSYPHFPIACASTITPSGMIAAGKHGLGVLSIGAGLPGGPEAMAKQWAIYEETAAKHGHKADRSKWRIVVNAHIAEDDEQALREVHAGERCETVTYFEDTLGRPPGRSDDPLREGVAQGTTLVGNPDTVAKGIQRLLGYSNGGFGGILFRAHEWANREQTMRSYELFARYVMPQFQGSLDTIVGSNAWARENRKAVFGPTVAAVKKAFTDVGREVPDEFRSRTVGARDVAGD